MPTRLSHQDLRAICRIVGECGELWADPDAWQQHLLGELSRLIHLPIGLSAKVFDFHAGQNAGICWAVEHGWAGHGDQAIIFRIRSEQTPEPFGFSPVDRRFRRALQPASVTTRCRGDLLRTRDWHRSLAFNEYFAPAGMPELLYSAARLEDGNHHLLCFGGSTAVPDEHARELIELVHGEIAAQIGRRLATPDQICLQGLTARQRDVLVLIQRGSPEKEIADMLRISGPTVNEHLQRIYRHFRVNSRAGLMAYLLRRSPVTRASSAETAPRPTSDAP